MLRQYHDKSSTKKKGALRITFYRKAILKRWHTLDLRTLTNTTILLLYKIFTGSKNQKKKVDRHNIFCFSPLALLHTCAFVPVATKWKKREEPTNAENLQCFTRRKLLGSYILLGPKEALEIQKNTTNVGSETFSLPAQCQCRKLIN